MANLRSLLLCALAGVLLGASAMAQTAAPAARPAARIVPPVDESHLVTLHGNVHPQANARNDLGPVSASFQLPDLTLVLGRGADEQAAFDAHVAGEYDPGSPYYPQWLTPAQIGEQFGPAPSDIAAVTGWLASHGLAVKSVSPDRMTIHFSGTAAQVESAFHTEIHSLSVNGERRYANMTDPQIPDALSPVIVGVKALHNFLPRPLHKVGSVVQFNREAGGWQRAAGGALVFGGLSATAATESPALAGIARPQFGYVDTTSGLVVEDIAPYDFATIYNVLPLWKAGTPINGTGQTIAIAGTSLVNANDVTLFRSAFGLPAGSLKQIDTGAGGKATECTSSSGFCGISDLVENSLDVEWSGAIAPGAQVDLVVTGQPSGCQSNGSGCIDSLFDSAQYVVDNLTAKILSVSYGMCELGNGTSGNVAYYNLWQSAAAEGIAVFVATGDSGSPACDQGGDAGGYPYSAQLGLGVNGLASTPFNTAVGGTDLAWCKPAYDSNGNFTGCPTSYANAGPYWNTSGNSSTSGGLSSAVGYVPEIPWNDTCMNPIWAAYLESLAPLTGYATPANSEAACNYVQNDWLAVYEQQMSQTPPNPFVMAYQVDTVGGGGGASGCVVNSTGNDYGTCTTNATSVSNGGGSSIPLTSDGWQKPIWQAGVQGIPTDGVRDIPDVSFFSGDGGLQSATLVCATAAGGTCTASASTESFLEIGGTSVATPEMAGVMALINQKAGGPQGLPNASLYTLAGKQTYSSCSAESVTASGSCYFNDIDSGTVSMPCDYQGKANIGGAQYNSNTGNWTLVNNGNGVAGTASPNCMTVNSGDVVGTLSADGKTAAYNAGVAYDLATGLGSLNVANIVNASVWTPVGTETSTVSVNPASASITPDVSLAVPITVSGGSGTPTGSITLSSDSYVSAATDLQSGGATITIPADSLTGSTNPFVATLTVSYSGDATYAQSTGTATVTVTKRNPTVTVTPAAGSLNSNVALRVTVAVTGGGSSAPSGTVTLAGGGYSSSTSLSGGSASFTIPANTFTTGGVVDLSATYSGDTTYVSGTGSADVTVSYIAVLNPTVTVTPASSSIYAGQSLSVTVTVGGANGAGTGSVTLSGGGYTSAATALTSGSATITIPPYSLSTGTDTLTATSTADANYYAGIGTATVTVSQSGFSLSATTPAAVSPGTSATSTITGTSSTTDYSGAVTLNSCTLTNSSVTNPSPAPACSVSGTITYSSSGTASGTGTATVTTTAASSSSLARPRLGSGWIGAGGMALALLVFFGIPARRRSWRAMLGVLVLIAALSSLSACGGGGGGGGGGGSAGTPAGTYTFTVSGTGKDAGKTVGTGAFTLTVN